MGVVALLFMGGTTVSVTLLHGLEAAIWAVGFRCCMPCRTKNRQCFIP
jgi:hypothetical protein